MTSVDFRKNIASTGRLGKPLFQEASVPIHEQMIDS
jgi:hypothetical protein